MSKAELQQRYYLVSKRFVHFLLLSIIVVIVCAILFRALWLPWFGHALVLTEPAQQVDAIVVLGGGGSSDRERTGARLVKEGFADHVYTTGTTVGISGLVDITWAGLAAAELINHGVSPHMITELDDAGSTCGEAHSTYTALTDAEIKSILLVTDPFHTYRAHTLFTNTFADTDIEIIPYAADPSWFDADTWWTHAGALNAVGTEYMKLAYLFLVGCWEWQ